VGLGQPELHKANCKNSKATAKADNEELNVSEKQGNYMTELAGEGESKRETTGEQEG
jgi:hypothetical protein